MSTDIKDVVKEKYGRAALRFTSGDSCCCGAAPADQHSSTTLAQRMDPIT
jgi:hypothetical protein